MIQRILEGNNFERFESFSKDESLFWKWDKDNKQIWKTESLKLNVLCISESCIEIKINLNFCFHTSLWCLKRFYEGLKGLHITFRGTTKKCENKN